MWLTFSFTHFVNVCALCCRYVSLCALMACRLFLSISLAAAGTLLVRKVSGNQMMFATRVTAGTYVKMWTHKTFNPQARSKKTMSRDSHWTEIHLFTDIEQRLVKLFVNTPENVKVKHKETTDTSIFVSLVNFWRFTWKREKKHNQK